MGLGHGREEVAMKVAVIGAGNVGRALARAIQGAGHDVVMSARSPDRLGSVASELGVGTARSNGEAARDADAVVLAVPFRAVDEVLSELGAHLDGKILIDPTNALKPDYSGLALEGSSAAEFIQGKVPGAKVVKAFNMMFAENQADPTFEGAAFDGLAAGNDAEAKQTVLELLRRIGYRPLDAGPLEAARYLEALAFLNIWLNATNGWGRQSGWKLLGAPE
jgi:NADPH-dependent F420 reductase